MDLTNTFEQLAIALGLGLLVGLQREYAAAAHLAGLRTFPLITVLGTLCGILAKTFGGWVIAAGFLSLAGLALIGNFVALENNQNPLGGITSEVAILLMFSIGAFLTIGPPEIAIALGGSVAVLLQLKKPLRGLVSKLGDNDLKAIMQFVLIALVILPVLPNQKYGPYSVFNPYKMWLMVVLIVGINLGGYIVYKYRFFGEEVGIAVSGILGGMISSTATTVSYAKRSANAPETNKAAALVIVIASTIVFIRVLLEIAIVAPDFLHVASLPILIMFAAFVVLCGVSWFSSEKIIGQMPEQDNPAQLKSALFFSFFYVVVLFTIAIAKDFFGSKGLYVIAAISGLTDIDAITLSTSQLVQNNTLVASNGWRVIIIAILANLAFKAGMVAVLGNRQLFHKILLIYSLGFIVGIAVLLLLN
jgi:uncharacterized membrane protein (DUF4010 family)